MRAARGPAGQVDKHAQRCAGAGHCDDGNHRRTASYGASGDHIRPESWEWSKSLVSSTLLRGCRGRIPYCHLSAWTLYHSTGALMLPIVILIESLGLNTLWRTDSSRVVDAA